MKHKILIVEDDMHLALTLSDRLVAEGYDVLHSTHGRELPNIIISEKLNLIVLDLMLGENSGIDICKNIRHKKLDIPIIMLTALSRVQDKIAGLKTGADDYLTKPFDSNELVARIEALLRRSASNHNLIDKFKFDNIDIDFAAMTIKINGSLVEMTFKEFQLLKFLIENKGRSVSREEILEQVWGYDSDISTRTIDTHIGWIRQKIELNPKTPIYIRTVFGHGYIFNDIIDDL